MNSSERHTVAAPARLGTFEVIRPLARGGMAELFLVRTIGPEGFEKVVVQKRVLPHLAEDQRFVRAFLDEAKLVAALDHPNIAPVYEMGRVDGSYYFTMEYVRGLDMRAILKRCRRTATPLPIEHAVIIARDIASALHYAHERRAPDGRLLGLVHRDVSPSNVIVSFEGAPKLIDFGIAKATAVTTKTQTGTLKGKVAYMSPEQARGAAIDRRTDVFALGVILWEVLAGKRLFDGDNDLATLQRIIYEPAPNLSDVRTDCPAALARIVARALALEPAARYQTAQELQLELEEFAHEQKLRLSTFALGTYLREHFPEHLRDASDLTANTVTGVTAPASDEDLDDLEVFDPSVAAPAIPGAAFAPLPRPQRRSRRAWIAAAVVVATMAAVTVSIRSGSESPARARETAASPPAPGAASASAPLPITPSPARARVATPEAKHAVMSPTEHVTRSTPKRPHKITKSVVHEPAAPVDERVNAEAPAKKPKVPFDPNSVFPP